MADAIWRAIIEQVQAISPPIFATFSPPATQKDIELLERRVGVALPPSFKDYLATVNGQNEAGADHPLMMSFRRLFGVADIIKQMDFMESLFDETDITALTENKIRPLAWSPRWIPFAWFEGYDALVLDLDPGVNGTYGQVWILSSGSDTEADDAVLADSFEDFSQTLLWHLKERRFSIENGHLVFDNYWSA